MKKVSIFLLFIPFASFGGWQINTIDYNYGGTVFGCDIGDGDNDGNIEVYTACEDGYVYQHKWDDTSWVTTSLDGSVGWWMDKVIVGDGDDDGENEVYGITTWNAWYQYIWNGTSWERDDLIPEPSSMSIGDGDNDGTNEIYFTRYDTVWCRKWNGASWDENILKVMPKGVCNIIIGDGNNDGENELYFRSRKWGIYELKWDGVTWVDTTVVELDSTFTNCWNLALGDGNNDGENELYTVECEKRGGTYCTTYVYQYKKGETSWSKDFITTIYRVNAIAVGDGNRDGENEVYLGHADGPTAHVGRLYQLKWNGSSWEIGDMGRPAVATVTGIVIGDGDNDGKIEVYATPCAGVYQYIYYVPPILSGTGEPNFEIDGVDPDTGQSGDTFEFRVSYSSENNFSPMTKELQVDLNDDGYYQRWEKFSMTETDTTDTTFTDGKVYAKSMNIDYAGDGILKYRFVFADLYDAAIGEPTEDHTFVVLSTGIVEGIGGNRELFQISPNPFSTKTEIRIQMSEVGQGFSLANLKVCPTIQIYDLSGRLVRSFKLSTDNRQLLTVYWDGTNNSGNKVASGIYFCSLKGGDFIATKKMTILR